MPLSARKRDVISGESEASREGEYQCGHGERVISKGIAESIRFHGGIDCLMLGDAKQGEFAAETKWRFPHRHQRCVK
jgi:hypothetical protein